ncbi:hypothetical protein [Ferruginibacter sp.]|uniref:hypothetical protein n=1 Tax=Ferruginibacter sp. TaxID=1940288 RepID=UPI002658304E|nr:hypothetical protein [Ferruginibacter sp.]
MTEKINAAGFWAMPIQDGCGNDGTDGAGFTLEANTKKKYQIVFSGECTPTSFQKICSQILALAKLNNHSLYE